MIWDQNIGQDNIHSSEYLMNLEKEPIINCVVMVTIDIITVKSN